MEQLTVRLPVGLSQALQAAAARMRRPRAELVRLALSEFLGVGELPTPDERVRHLIGSLGTGVPDLAENHRAYVLGSLARGR